MHHFPALPSVFQVALRHFDRLNLGQMAESINDAQQIAPLPTQWAFFVGSRVVQRCSMDIQRHLLFLYSWKSARLFWPGRDRQYCHILWHIPASPELPHCGGRTCGSPGGWIIVLTCYVTVLESGIFMNYHCLETNICVCPFWCLKDPGAVPQDQLQIMKDTTLHKLASISYWVK